MELLFGNVRNKSPTLSFYRNPALEAIPSGRSKQNWAISYSQKAPTSRLRQSYCGYKRESNQSFRRKEVLSNSFGRFQIVLRWHCAHHLFLLLATVPYFDALLRPQDILDFFFLWWVFFLLFGIVLTWSGFSLRKKPQPEEGCVHGQWCSLNGIFYCRFWNRTVCENVCKIENGYTRLEIFLYLESVWTLFEKMHTFLDWKWSPPVLSHSIQKKMHQGLRRHCLI